VGRSAGRGKNTGGAEGAEACVRTNRGFALEVDATVVALVFSNVPQIKDETGLPPAWAP